MSSLNAFLNPVKVENKKVIISDRFLDENKKPIPFEIKAITQDENKKLIRKNTKRDKKGMEIFNRADYLADLAVSGTVFPDFNNAKLQEGYNCLGAVSLIQKMLLMGEFAELVTQIQSLSGIEEDINDDIEEAKN